MGRGQVVLPDARSQGVRRSPRRRTTAVGEKRCRAVVVTSAIFASCKSGRLLSLRGRRMSAAAPQRLEWRSTSSNLDRLGNGQRILKLNAEVAHAAVHLSVAQQRLHRREVAGLLADPHSLCPSHGMGAVGVRLDRSRRPGPSANGCTGASRCVAGNGSGQTRVSRSRSSPGSAPARDGSPRPFCDLDLPRPLRLPLDDRRPFLDAPGDDDVPDLETDEVQLRGVLSMAKLKRARSRRLPAIPRRARIAQTCFGSSGRFLPTMRSLVPG